MIVLKSVNVYKCTVNLNEFYGTPTQIIPFSWWRYDAFHINGSLSGIFDGFPICLASNMELWCLFVVSPNKLLTKQSSIVFVCLLLFWLVFCLFWFCLVSFFYLRRHDIRVTSLESQSSYPKTLPAEALIRVRYVVLVIPDYPYWNIFRLLY